MATVKVGKKSQITVPAAARRQLGIASGDRLEVTVEHSRIVLVPQAKSWSERWARIAPEIWKGSDAGRYLRELREEWSSWEDF